MTNRLRDLCARLFLALGVTAGFVIVGCGEPEPAPLTKEDFEAAKAKQELMLKKEYGLDKAGVK